MLAKSHMKYKMQYFSKMEFNEGVLYAPQFHSFGVFLDLLPQGLLSYFWETFQFLLLPGCPILLLSRIH